MIVRKQTEAVPAQYRSYDLEAVPAQYRSYDLEAVPAQYRSYDLETLIAWGQEELQLIKKQI